MLKRTGLFVMLVLIVIACAKTPVTGKQVFILTSEAEEAELGRQAYQEILAKSKLSTNRGWTEVVNRAAGRIAKASNKSEYEWEFKLIESAEKNAFCLPGGKIAVYTGMFEILSNEAELAAVLGHEVAHATARHAGQRITLQFGEEAGFAGLAALMGGTDTLGKKILMQALGVGAAIGAVLPFGRSQEAESDQIGEVYMAQAGYDPSAAVTLWQTFAKSSSKMPEFLSTHPNPENRISALSQHLPEAQVYYTQAPQKYGLGEVFSPRRPRQFTEIYAASQSSL